MQNEFVGTSHSSCSSAQELPVIAMGSSSRLPGEAFQHPAAWNLVFWTRVHENGICGPFFINPDASGCDFLFESVEVRVEKLADKPQQTHARSRATSLPLSAAEELALIRSNLSVNITELAELLDVSRQAIYAWIRVESVPRDETKNRLDNLAELAQKWAEISTYPMGEALKQISPGGQSFFARLISCGGNFSELWGDLEPIASLVSSRKARKKGFLKSLNEQGATFLDTEDKAQLDLRTGKRFSNE